MADQEAAVEDQGWGSEHSWWGMALIDGSEPYSSECAGSGLAIITLEEHARGMNFNFQELGFGWRRAKTNPEHLGEA